jgi:hypothetical protein
VLRYIKAIDDKTNKRQYYLIRKIVIDADLKQFEIEIKNNVVLYKQHELVRFKNPDSDVICADSDAICAVSDVICAGFQEI